MSRKVFVKPWIIVGLLVIIPSSLFTSIQLLNMSDQEEVIASIYTDQLTSVLSSINQYADDIINDWINAEGTSNLTGKHSENTLITYKASWPVDTISHQVQINIPEDQELQNAIRQPLSQYQKELNQLIAYHKSGYRKISGIELQLDNRSLITFISERNQQYLLNTWVLDAHGFIVEALGPRMQMLAADKLVIAVREKDGEMIYSSLLNTDPESVVEEQSIWLLPGYLLGLQPQGINTSMIARQRSIRNIGLLLLVDIILIVGAWFFYRNVRREMQLAKIKSDFVSNVSHEIRTPLALVSMYAETLKLGRLKEEGKRQNYYDIIYRETQRLSGIVNNILNFSRMENGRQELNMSHVDLNDIVETVLGNYRYHLKEKKFEVNIDLDYDLEMLEGDQQALTECVVNLMDNAIKYSVNVKHLSLRTYQTKSHAIIEVGDKGIGIPVAEKKHIFDKFYRVTKGALAHHAKGSGLGLSIVTHLIKEHKGKVEVDSAEGKGSTFRILLPITENNTQR